MTGYGFPVLPGGDRVPQPHRAVQRGTRQDGPRSVRQRDGGYPGDRGVVPDKDEVQRLLCKFGPQHSPAAIRVGLPGRPVTGEARGGELPYGAAISHRGDGEEMRFSGRGGDASGQRGTAERAAQHLGGDRAGVHPVEHTRGLFQPVPRSGRTGVGSEVVFQIRVERPRLRLRQRDQRVGHPSFGPVPGVILCGGQLRHIPPGWRVRAGAFRKCS